MIGGFLAEALDFQQVGAGGSGRVEAAVAEVRNTPGVASASGWIRDAERYAAAQNALDLIETAAVLEPRRLRDGAGNAIEQPSPATAPLP